MYDIIIRFPSKDVADEFCRQMSNGFGKSFCDFSFWQKKAGTDGKKKSGFERVTSSAPEGTEVYFAKSIEEH